MDTIRASRVTNLLHPSDAADRIVNYYDRGTDRRCVIAEKRHCASLLMGAAYGDFRPKGTTSYADARGQRIPDPQGIGRALLRAAEVMPTRPNDPRFFDGCSLRRVAVDPRLLLTTGREPPTGAPDFYLQRAFDLLTGDWNDTLLRSLGFWLAEAGDDVTLHPGLPPL